MVVSSHVISITASRTYAIGRDRHPQFLWTTLCDPPISLPNSQHWRAPRSFGLVFYHPRFLSAHDLAQPDPSGPRGPHDPLSCQIGR